MAGRESTLRHCCRGQGKYTWPDGSSYTGSVKNGVRHGDGTIQDGEVTYTGQWVDGKKNGDGVTLTDRKECTLGASEGTRSERVNEYVRIEYSVAAGWWLGVAAGWCVWRGIFSVVYIQSGSGTQHGGVHRHSVLQFNPDQLL